MSAGRLIRLLAVLVAALCLPAAAAAHAGLQQSDPADGEVVPTSPPAVVLTFTEAVESALAEVRVFNTDAEPVATGDLESQSARAIRLPIDAPLANGTYTVSWRILSADGHPIDGAFVFHVGAPGERPEGVAGEVGPGDRPGLERLDAAARILHLALIVLLLGALIVTVGIFTRLDADVARQMWYVVAGFGFALSIVAAATVVIQAALVTGSGLADATNGSVLSTVLETRLGKVRLTELIIAEVIAVGAVWASSPSGAAWLRYAVLGLGGVLAVTPGLSGHAGAQGPLAVIADAGHVLAAAGWVGGLVAVLIGLRMAGERRRELARVVWPRYSTLALVSVGVLIVAGTIGSFTHVDAVAQLWETDYGRLLLAKMAIALGLIGFGVWNRAAVRRLSDEGQADQGLRRLTRSVRVELGVMAAAIVVTSFLIARPPSDSASAAPATQVAANATAGDIAVRVVADPGSAGTNVVTLTLRRGEAAVIDADVAVVVRPEEGDIGRLRRDAVGTQPGTYVAEGVQMSTPGDWIVDVDIRSGEFDLVSTTVTLPIRPSGG